jgi:glyoxylase-like metal-dependent hydrolase (beta-lactamase superfamily II)
MSDQTWTEPGTFEVLPGVFRVPLPLPNDGLRAVNVYVIDDGDGLVLIDAGWALAESQQQLERSLAAIERKLADIRQFLVTHIHRDHYTQAISIRRLFGTSVQLGAGERPTLERLIDPAFAPLSQPLTKLSRAGGAELAEQMRAHMSASGDSHHEGGEWEFPDGWLTQGTLQLNSRALDVIPTPGHTVGHVVFHDPRATALFAGDHVLPQITPSIGLEAAGSHLPLVDYLNSLRLMRSLPDARLLPAHGPVTDSVHARVDALLDHHEVRLTQCATAVEAGASTALDAANILRWTRRGRQLSELDVFNQVLAVTETMAHLDVLVARGWLRSWTGADGAEHYARA